MPSSLRTLPFAHKITLTIALAVLGMAGYLFVNWISTPTYSLLYSGLDDTALAEVIDELDRAGVAYQIEAGGSRVLVPQNEVYRVRAQLASAGVRSGSTPEGYELLEDQGLNVSDFRQRVDYQRALEGELSRTLVAMEPVSSATVHLVIPDDALFAEDQEPVKASVLVESDRQLSALEVETITFVVASSVEGLEPAQVTVADASGAVLQAAGEAAEGSTVTNRNLRMTRDFEAVLTADVQRLLDSAIGPGLATVVVRADLDFDESATESETFDPDSAVVIKQQRVDETFTGSGSPPGGVIGVDGNAPEPDDTVDTYDYSRTEVLEETGIDRTVTRTVKAPGRIRSLSVAVVMDDGTNTGVTPPETTEVERLVTAALGLDSARGDTVAVSSVAFAAPEEVEADTTAAAAEPAEEEAADPMMTMLPQVAGGAVLVLVALALLWMTRRGRRSAAAVEPTEATGPVALPAPDQSGGGAAAAIPARASPARSADVVGLIEKQPEEIAVLLRSWLADRR
jgi:flagellar M-ring protein FliF